MNDLEHKRELWREACRRYRARHRELVRQRGRAAAKREWATNKAKVLARPSRSRARATQYQYQWRASHAAAWTAYRRDYAWRNRAQINARMREWRARHREVGQHYSALRRARLAGATGSWGPQEFRDLLVHFDYRCVYCGHRGGRFHADHVVPLSRGGSNHIGNIVPACPSCNRRKGAKSADEFLAYLRAIADKLDKVA